MLKWKDGINGLSIGYIWDEICYFAWNTAQNIEQKHSTT